MSLSVTVKRMILVIGISSAVISLIAAGYYAFFSAEPFLASWLPFVIGVFLMGALNCLKVLMIKSTVSRALDMDSPGTARGFVSLQYLVRFLATGVILWVSHTAPFINLWGAVAGVFTFQIAAHSLRFFER